MASAGRSDVFHRSVPLHHQIQGLLRARIEAGEWAAGERIPTEMALVDHFRVSRATLREALRALERDGLIARHRRRGSFVRPSAPDAAAGRTITNLVLGYETAIRVVSVAPAPAPVHVTSFLGVARGQLLHRFVRVEVVDGAPLAVVVNYMASEYGRRIRRRDLARYSMLEVLHRIGIRLGPIRQQLEARMPDEQVAELLGIDVTQPVLFLRLLISDARGRPVEIADSFYRADRYRYELILPRVAQRTLGPSARRRRAAVATTAAGGNGAAPAELGAVRRAVRVTARLDGTQARPPAPRGDRKRPRRAARPR